MKESDKTVAMKKSNWRNMRESTAEDWHRIAVFEANWELDVMVPRILSELKALDDDSAPFPISRFQHALQSATLAYRDDAEEELVVAALLHDIGDNFSVHSHAQVAAAIIKPYVSEKTHWIIHHHAIFQGYYFWHHLEMDRHARDQYRDHPWFDDCVYFCEHYDQAAFDSDYDTLPLDFFEPMVKRIFSRKPYGEHLNPFENQAETP